MRAYVDIDGLKHAIQSIHWHDDGDKIAFLGMFIDGKHETVFQRGGVDKMHKDSDGIDEPMHLDLNKHVYWEKTDRKSTRLNSSHVSNSYAVFCLKKKK